MNLTELIQHPERMDRETLYDLRSLLALHPCFQTARLLLLQNLYILHDSSFDEELRKAAIYITDRRVIFNMIEAAHYKLRTRSEEHTSELQSRQYIVCRLLLEKKKIHTSDTYILSPSH